MASTCFYFDSNHSIQVAKLCQKPAEFCFIGIKPNSLDLSFYKVLGEYYVHCHQYTLKAVTFVICRNEHLLVGLQYTLYVL